MSSTVKGACHCKAVEWTVELPEKKHVLWYAASSFPLPLPLSLPLPSSLPPSSLFPLLFPFFFPLNISLILSLRTNSHCNTCKITAGSAFSLNQIVPKTDLKITKGEGQLTDYIYKGDSGKDVHCYFCKACGVHVYHWQMAAEDKVIAKTAPLEGMSAFEPAAEVYGKSRFPWVKEVAHTFETLPPS